LSWVKKTRRGVDRGKSGQESEPIRTCGEHGLPSSPEQNTKMDLGFVVLCQGHSQKKAGVPAKKGELV